jgi:hypothetical protein
MEPRQISEELIHEFTETMDDAIPVYSDEDQNIIMPNGGTTREYVLTEVFAEMNKYVILPLSPSVDDLI